MFSSFPSPRWIPVVILFAIGALISGTVHSRKTRMEELANVYCNPFDSDTAYTEGPFIILSVTKWFVYAFAITLLFPPNYQNYVVQLDWAIRQSSIVPFPYAFAVVAPVSLIIVLTALSRHASSPLIVSFIHTMNYLLFLAAFGMYFVFILDLVHSFALFDYHSLRSRPGWLPAWLLWTSMAIFGFSLPYLMVSMHFLIIFFTEVTAPPARAAITFFRISIPYINRRQKWRLVSHYSISSRYESASASLDIWDAAARILFVSDLHISSSKTSVMGSRVPSSHTLDRLNSINRVCRPDVIIMLGDMTDTGHPEAWQTLATTSQSLNTPIIAIPGNHDYHFRSYNDFSSLPMSYLSREVLKNIAPLCGRDYIVRSYPHVVRIASRNILVVMLDSNLRENSTPITNALGYVSSVQLSSADKELRSLRRRDDIVILILHHHIILPDGGPLYWYLQCIDARSILDFAEKNKVSLIAHGHLHMPMVIEYRLRSGAGHIPILSCGSLHHPASGPLAAEISGPSCFRVDVTSSGLI